MNTEPRPFLSIVLPAYNEERRLQISLPKIDAFLQAQPYTAEVIVVENGSSDRTAEVVRAYSQDHPYLRLIVAKTRGKGLAVKQGMLAARGEYCFMADVDLSMPIEELAKFLPPQLTGYDVVIGSRETKGAQRIDEPEYRHLMGRINNWLIKLIALNKFEYTQCGFKLFTHAAAQDLFSVQQSNGIGFDVELLFIAVKRGYNIYEMPVTWYFDAESKMRLWDDSVKLLKEIWMIRQNWQRGMYEPTRTVPNPTPQG